MGKDRWEEIEGKVKGLGEGFFTDSKVGVRPEFNPEWIKEPDPYFIPAWNKVEKYIDIVCNTSERDKNFEGVKKAFPYFVAVAAYTRQLGPKLKILASMLGERSSFKKLLAEFDATKSVGAESPPPLFVTPEDRGKAAGFVEKYIEQVMAYDNRTSNRNEAYIYLKNNKSQYIGSISILGQSVAGWALVSHVIKDIA